MVGGEKFSRAMEFLMVTTLKFSDMMLCMYERVADRSEKEGRRLVSAIQQVVMT